MLKIIGFIILMHAAYSSYEYRQIMKITSGVPHDIFLEIMTGLFAMLFGSIKDLQNVGRLSIVTAQEILPTEGYLESIEVLQAMVARDNLEVLESEPLETRLDFMNIRHKRKMHLDWIQST